MPDTTNRPFFYKNPPVIERVASVYAEIPEEIFEERFDEWRELVEAEYPVYEPLKEWLILVEEKEGIPMLSTARPELRITHRFSRKSSKEGFDWSIRCPAGQLTMNMHSKLGKGDERRYSHLRSEFEQWLPKWIKHFSVSEFSRVTVHYVNHLTRETVPSFFSDQTHLEVEQLLSVFTTIPGEHESIIPPYQCTANLVLPGRPNATLRIEVGGIISGAPGLKLDLVAQVELKGESVTPAQLLELIDWTHARIIDRFEAVFTEKAKKSFSPVEE
jgi:uncharacterized protein (TIGR04255 family)